MSRISDFIANNNHAFTEYVASKINTARDFDKVSRELYTIDNVLRVGLNESYKADMSDLDSTPLTRGRYEVLAKEVNDKFKSAKTVLRNDMKNAQDMIEKAFRQSLVSENFSRDIHLLSNKEREVFEEVYGIAKTEGHHEGYIGVKRQFDFYIEFALRILSIADKIIV